MWKIKPFKSKKVPQDSGFITLEIIVAIIVALGFVLVSMQTLVYAMMIKVQAQEKQRANQLIQEDIETANEIGSNLVLGSTVECNPANYNNSFANALYAGLVNELGSNPTKNIGQSGGRQIRLTRTDVTSSSSTLPYRTLRVQYLVEKQDFSNNNNWQNLTETYVEIIPDAALSCP